MKWLNSLIIAVFLISACNSAPVPETVAYSEIKEGQCDDDAFNAYHYVVPEKSSGRFPLLIILDSGGDGLFGIKKCLPAAGNIPCVIIGSDLVRNNFPNYIRAILELIQDAEKKYPVDKEMIYIAGFSGGARMALEYARDYPVKGVLMCGAGPGQNSFRDLPCAVYMIAGTTDFNFGEMYYNPLKADGQKNFMADYFRGGHEWPPANNLNDGLLYLMGKNEKKLLKRESVSLVNKADSLLAINETLFAIKALEKSLAFNSKNPKAKTLHTKISKNSNAEESLGNLETNLFLERKIGQAYVEAMLNKDSLFWANEFRQLKSEIAGTKGEANDHFMRIKAFLGIMFFSRVNALIRADDNNEQLAHLLAAYRMIEPANPDVYYDYALYEKSQNHEAQSIVFLKKAISLGFKDKVKLKQDFPGFVQ
jgi:hypothetical protein